MKVQMKISKESKDPLSPNWLDELSRDFLALGSWIFFLLVVVRVLILPYRWPYLNHLLVAGGLILLVDIFVRGKVEGYVARCIVLSYYLCLFYENQLFSIFVTLAVIGLLMSSKHLGNSWKKIGLGILVGLIGIGVRFIL